MSDKPNEDVQVLDAIEARRKDEPPEITEAWRIARAGNFRFSNQSKHWDGKFKKTSQPF